MPIFRAMCLVRNESSLLRHSSREGDQVLRINYVLIDFENVQPESIAALEQSHYRVLIFVGATQAKLPFEVVSSIQRMGERARYIRMSGSGPNALDFHIAFYIGELASADPTASFHIISKDTGFDPLIRHLKARHISAARSPSVAAMTQIKASPKKKVASERARIIVELLRQPKSTKPRTDTTLGSAHRNVLPEAEALGSRGRRGGGVDAECRPHLTRRRQGRLLAAAVDVRLAAPGADCRERPHRRAVAR
jgi:hypothetical protein